jgi:hypothetical protein
MGLCQFPGSNVFIVTTVSPGTRLPASTHSSSHFLALTMSSCVCADFFSPPLIVRKGCLLLTFSEVYKRLNVILNDKLKLSYVLF